MIVTATDSSNNTSTQNVTVNISDVDEGETANLVDSRVEGVNYICGTISGVTDTNGTFIYENIKCPNGVEFKIGNLSLGSIKPSDIKSDKYLTLQELAGVARDNVIDANVTKLAILLQSLDDNSNANDGILITQNIRNTFGTDENLSNKTDEEVISLILSAGKTPKDPNDALNHLLAFTKSIDSSVVTNITPNDFNFTSVTGLAQNTEIISNQIKIEGLTIPVYITISNGEYKINNGEWKSTKSLVINDDNIRVRHITANNPNGEISTILHIGGVTKTFRSTTTEIIWKNKSYDTIISPVTGKVWLDRNLGATSVCKTSNTLACYGDYYQWGREADGHQIVNSETTYTLTSDLNSTSHNKFIDSPNYPFDWTTDDANGTIRSANWSKTDGSSICPVGYRVPRIDELVDENIKNLSDAYDMLKLPPAGHRNDESGALELDGLQSYTWSASSNVVYSMLLDFDMHDQGWGYGIYRAFGSSVRCIKAE